MRIKKSIHDRLALLQLGTTSVRDHLLRTLKL